MSASMKRLLLPIGLVGLAGFWLGHAADVPWLRLVAKPVPVLALAAAAVGASTPIAIGLLLGACGDLLLELGLFLPGLVAFLVGHVAYAVAFGRRAGARVPVAALPALALVGVVIALLWPSLGGMRVPVLGYALAMFVMLQRAGAWYVGPGGGRATAALVGAYLFAFSDALIALDRFHAPIPNVRVAILATYWTAQALITRSET